MSAAGESGRPARLCVIGDLELLTLPAPAGVLERGEMRRIAGASVAFIVPAGRRPSAKCRAFAGTGGGASFAEAAEPPCRLIKKFARKVACR
jgi:hypothetical protein